MSLFNNKLSKVPLGMLDTDVQNKFTGYDTSLAEKANQSDLDPLASKDYVNSQILTVNTGGTVDLSYKADKTDLNDVFTLNDHAITYGYDSNGNVQTVTEKDSSNNTIKTVTYTYNTSGDVSQSVTVMNGKTVTTTYNYDSTTGNITSTSNVIS